MFKFIKLVAMLLLFVGCQNQNVDVDNLSMAKAQIIEFNGDAKNIVKTLSTSAQNLQTLGVSQNFVGKLKELAQQVVLKNPKLQTSYVFLSEISQISFSCDFDSVLPYNYAYVVFSSEYQANAYDWAVKFIVNTDSWELLDWKVNLAPNGQYISASNIFPSTSSETAYTRRIALTNACNPAKVTLDDFVEFGVVNLGDSNDARLYRKNGKFYKITKKTNTNSLGLSLQPINSN